MRQQQRNILTVFISLLMCGVVYAAVNVSGAGTGTGAEVDTTPKALRTAPYDGAGNPIFANETWRGIFAINVRQSAATTNGAAVWGIYNTNGTKTVIVKRLYVQLFFDGTAAATDMKYEIIKATGISAFSGGTAPTALLKKTTYGSATSAVCRVLDTGLTTTGITAQNTAWFFTMGRATQTTTAFTGGQFFHEFGFDRVGEIELANQEALLIRNNVTSVIGDNVVGWAEVSEK